MCINIQTSLAAFAIGEVSGLMLLQRQNVEHKLIGLFVMFFTLIQGLEALMYNDNQEIYSKLLLLNLSLQGLVFFMLMKNVYPINNEYFIICGLVFLFVMFNVLQDTFVKASVESCMKWNFMTWQISLVLGIMYLAMFYWFFVDATKSEFLLDTGLLFGITLVISFFIVNYKNAPSIWCMTSAIAAPLLLLL